MAKITKIYTEQELIELLQSRKAQWVQAHTGIPYRRVLRIIRGQTRVHLDEANAIVKAFANEGDKR